MARKNYEYELEITADTKGLDKAAVSAEDLEAAMKGTGDAAADALTVLAAKADDMEAKLRGTVTAADAVKVALGDAFDGDSARIEGFVQDLNRMGVSFDEIQAKAKEFADVIQRADTIKLDAANAGLTNVGNNLDRVRDSGDQSRSVLANLAGNSAQDLGELGGVVGTLGVGIGQLAEYAVDGNIAMSNLAKVAGPMAGLAAITAVGTKLWGDYQKRQQEVAENTAEAAEELLDITGIVEALNTKLRSQGEIGDFGDQLVASLNAADEDFNDVLAAATALGIEFTDLGDIISGLGEKGDVGGFAILVDEIQRTVGVTREQAEGIAQALSDASDPTSWSSLTTQIGQTTDLTVDQRVALQDVLELWGLIGGAAKDTDIDKTAKEFVTQLSATVEGLEQVQAARDRLADQGIVDPSNIQIAAEVGRAVDSAAEAAERWAQANQQIDPNDLRWTLVRDGANALREGMELTETQMQAVDSLMAQYGMTQEQVLDQGIQLWNDHQTKVEEAAEAERVATEEAAAALLEMQSALDELAGSLDDVADRGDAFTTAIGQFRELGELGQSQELIGFVGALEELGGAVDELANAEGLAGLDLVPDTWDEVLAMPEELGPVVDAIAGLADQVNTEMAQAFDTGGAAGVQEWAANTRQAITDTLRGAGVESQEQIDQVLSALGLLPEQVDIAIVVSNQARARSVLDSMAAAVAGLPTEVQLQIAAVADTDPIAALQLAISALEDAGVEVPIELVALVDEFESSVDEVAGEERTAEVEAEATNLPATRGLLDGLTDPRDAPIKPFVPFSIALGVGAILGGIAAAREAPITAVAYTSSADSALDGVAGPRSAAITAFVRDLPTESELIARMTGGKGYLRIPVDTYPRNVARFSTRAI